MTVYPSYQIYLSKLNAQFIRLTLQNRGDKSLPIFLRVIDRASKWYLKQGFLQHILILEQGLYNEIPFISIENANSLLKDKNRLFLYKWISKLEQTNVIDVLPKEYKSINKFLNLVFELRLAISRNQNRLNALKYSQHSIKEQRKLDISVREEIDNIYRIQSESIPEQPVDDASLEFLSLTVNPFDYAS